MNVSISPFPDFPGWQVGWFENHRDKMTTYEIAAMVQSVWHEYSQKADAAVIGLADRILHMNVSDDTMIRHIEKLSKIPPKPTIIKHKAVDDTVMHGMQEYANTNIHKDWLSWGGQVQELYYSLADVVSNNTFASSGFYRNAQSSIDSIFSRLTISKPALATYDLRHVFRGMLDDVREPLAFEKDETRQTRTFLNLLFEAVQEAQDMTDPEAESFVDRMESLGLEPTTPFDLSTI